MANLTPAVPNPEENTTKELSPVEFQQMLTTWFQEKGLIQDVKSYLKVQMISVLKNTGIGENIRKCASRVYTLSQQALHLVVGEYLLYHHCNFALSVFSSEVNLANILPQSRLFQNETHDIQDRFDKENLVHILELLGITRHNPSSAKIVHEYYNKSRNSLLNCLLSIISTETVNELEFQIGQDEIEDEFLRNVHQALQSYNLPSKLKIQLFNTIKVCYDLKNRSYENQIFQLISKFRAELKTREKKLYSNYKKRKHLEKKTAKLKEENQALKKCTDAEQQVCKTMEPTVQCMLNHCSVECTNAKKTCESYKNKIEELNKVNSRQNVEIERLNSKYKELLNEFDGYLNKINVINSRLNLNDVIHEDSADKGSNTSLSLESVSEEVLWQARQKLRLLEEESQKLDVRINSFVIK